nr:hypothetical protein [Clostridia bacterium]
DPSSGVDSNHAYDTYLMERIRDAAYMAFADLHEAKFSAAENEAKNISFIRLFRMKDGSVRTNPGTNNPDVAHPLGKPNETMTLIKIEREGADDIYIVNFWVHADVIGGDVISADFPGVMRNIVENALPGVKCMFIQGAEGDVNHIDVNDPNRQKGFAQSQHMGRVLAASVIEVSDRTKEFKADKIVTGVRNVMVPTNPENDKLETAKEVIKLYRAGKYAEINERGYDMTMPEALRIAELENGPDAYEFHLTAIRIGDIAFAGLPGEPFVEIGDRIVAGSPFEKTIICALTDGAEIYFPTGDIYDEGGYEAKSSPIRKGADNIIVDNMTGLLGELK